jgi:hypothetical protein
VRRLVVGHTPTVDGGPGRGNAAGGKKSGIAREYLGYYP